MGQDRRSPLPSLGASDPFVALAWPVGKRVAAAALLGREHIRWHDARPGFGPCFPAYILFSQVLRLLTRAPVARAVIQYNRPSGGACGSPREKSGLNRPRNCFSARLQVQGRAAHAVPPAVHCSQCPIGSVCQVQGGMTLRAGPVQQARCCRWETLDPAVH